jgi:hypothetical protein
VAGLSDSEKEQLTLEAERLHREAALLSNTLADFAPDDVDGRKPVVEQILALREQWKDARYKLQYGVARKPEKPAKATAETVAGSAQEMHRAEIQLDLQRTRVNISKYEKKLADTPDHRLAPGWKNELARLISVREQYETELRK